MDAVQNIFLFNKTDFVIGNCLNDGLFALVIYIMILPHNKIGLNEGQERYRRVVDVARGAQKLCVVIFVKKADSNNFCFVFFFQIG